MEQFNKHQRQSTTSTTGLFLVGALTVGCAICTPAYNIDYEYEYLKSKNELRYSVDKTRLDRYVEDQYKSKSLNPPKEPNMYVYSAKFNLALHKFSISQKELDGEMVKILDDILLEKQSKPANFKF